MFLMPFYAAGPLDVKFYYYTIILKNLDDKNHGLWTPGEEIIFIAQLSKNFEKYGRH